MKIGNRVYCTKTLKHYGTEFFTKGKIYIITDINHCRYIISNECDSTSHFSLISPNDDEYQFLDHFYLENEYRKQKLKKIYESV